MIGLGVKPATHNPNNSSLLASINVFLLQCFSEQVEVDRPCATTLSCGRVGLFPRVQTSLQQGAEYPVELLQKSCAKLKLHTRLVLCTNYKSHKHDNPAGEQFIVCQSENKPDYITWCSLL